jgi:hypothetical protein
MQAENARLKVFICWSYAAFWLWYCCCTCDPACAEGLIFGSSIRFALLSSSLHGTYTSAYRCTCSCISGDPANHRTTNCATSRTSGSATFLLRRSIGRLRLSCLDISRRRRLRSGRIRVDACLLLGRVIAVGVIDELLIMTLALSRIGVKAHFICG